MHFRTYNPEKDKKSVLRIYQEVGWYDPEEDKDDGEKVFSFLEAGQAYVSEIRDEAECLVCTHDGTLQYLDEKLSLSCITGVITSRVARKQNLATRLTAMALAEAATKGDEIATLGIFDQGFYNRLGFGCNPYENWIAFDPSMLNVNSNKRLPHRLSYDDHQKVHESRLTRMPRHGQVNLTASENTRTISIEFKKSFGLGFHDDNNELTHCLWMNPKEEHGPYEVAFLAYRNYDQLLELLSCIKAMGDQVYTVEMREPPDIQLQDLLKKPFRFRDMTRKSKYENNMWAISYSQTRILNLVKCIEKTHLYSNGSPFNLKLHDPIDEYLDTNAEWPGIGGDYIISFGPTSEISEGIDDSLQTLSASVGAFTRMWLGVHSATGLSVTDNLEGPQSLLKELDDILRLPVPKPDWDY